MYSFPPVHACIFDILLNTEDISVPTMSSQNTVDRLFHGRSKRSLWAFLVPPPATFFTTGDDPRVQLGRGKPAPDIYLLALQTINSSLYGIRYGDNARGVPGL